MLPLTYGFELLENSFTRVNVVESHTCIGIVFLFFELKANTITCLLGRAMIKNVQYLKLLFVSPLTQCLQIGLITIVSFVLVT
jgi:hypothetical protein